MGDDDERDEDVAELRALIERARPADIVWEPPPEDLWDRIAARDRSGAGTGAGDAGRRGSRRADHQPAPPRVVGRSGVAAAAVLVVVTLAITRRGDDATVVAAVELERLGDTGSGRAELLDRDGAFQLRLETEGLDPDDGYLELWLIDPTVTQLVSLGPLHTDGIYDIPAGVDPAAFPIVDVSVEPVDGDPTHSGDSVLRGELTL